MNLSHLRTIRIVLSVVILVFILFFFLDFNGLGIQPTAQFLLQLQFFPSLLKFFTVFFVVGAMGFLLVLLLTFLFGRVYCSSICPMGTLQDFFIAFSKRLKSRKKKRFVYHSNQNNILRYSILGATLLFWIFGSLFLINLLDPYSNFGKISVTLLQPVVSTVNNGISLVLENFDIYTVKPMMPQTLPYDVVLVSVGIFAVIFSMSAWRGRLFCNTLCPVGSALSLISRRPVYQIAFNEGSCTLCGKCERVCKAECIDSKKKVVDTSRCISCFNCFSSCSHNGLYFKKNYLPSNQKVSSESTGSVSLSPLRDHESRDKRVFLLTIGAGLLSLPVWGQNRKGGGKGRGQGRGLGKLSEPGLIPTGSESPVTPPGSVGYEHFTDNCIACYLCVSACPTNVIVPSFFDYGLKGFMQPKLDFHKSFCNFDCVACTEVCPTGALNPLSTEEKKISQLGVAEFVRNSCIVTIDKTDCGACSEHCPTKAVHMVPYQNGLMIPEVRPELCIGCGACEFACPTTPYKAIFVESKIVHQQAVPIEDTEGPREHDEDEFPF